MYIGSLFREVREGIECPHRAPYRRRFQTVDGDEVWDSRRAGTVILAEEHLSYGLLVEIRPRETVSSLFSLYGHLSDITVSVGDKVAPLDVVGHVGENRRCDKSASALRAAARRCADKPVRVPTRYPRKLQRRKGPLPRARRRGITRRTRGTRSTPGTRRGIRGDTRPFEKGLAKTLIKGVFLGQSSGTIAR